MLIDSQMQLQWHGTSLTADRSTSSSVNILRTRSYCTEAPIFHLCYSQVLEPLWQLLASCKSGQGYMVWPFADVGQSMWNVQVKRATEGGRPPFHGRSSSHFFFERP